MLSVTHAFGKQLLRSMAVPPFKIREQPPFQSLAIYKIDYRFLNQTLESKQIEKSYTILYSLFVQESLLLYRAQKRSEKFKDHGISRCYSACFRKIARNRDLHQDRGIQQVSPTAVMLFLGQIVVDEVQAAP